MTGRRSSSRSTHDPRTGRSPMTGRIVEVVSGDDDPAKRYVLDTSVLIAGVRLLALRTPKCSSATDTALIANSPGSPPPARRREVGRALHSGAGDAVRSRG